MCICSEISKFVGDRYNYTSGRIAWLYRTRGRNSKPLPGSAAFSLTDMICGPAASIGSIERPRTSLSRLYLRG